MSDKIHVQVSTSLTCTSAHPRRTVSSVYGSTRKIFAAFERRASWYTGRLLLPHHGIQSHLHPYRSVTINLLYPVVPRETTVALRITSRYCLRLLTTKAKTVTITATTTKSTAHGNSNNSDNHNSVVSTVHSGTLTGVGAVGNRQQVGATCTPLNEGHFTKLTTIKFQLRWNSTSTRSDTCPISPSLRWPRLSVSL